MDNQEVNLEDNPGPRLGMRFKTANEAYKWYNEYARQVGFSVRINHQEKSRRDGEVISKSFVCSREGKRRDKYENRENRKKSVTHTRVGCQAFLMVKRRRGPGEDGWEVTKFHVLHNHDLVSPAKAQCLRSHKRRRYNPEHFIENGANVQVDNAFSSFEEGSGASVSYMALGGNATESGVVTNVEGCVSEANTAVEYMRSKDGAVSCDEEMDTEPSPTLKDGSGLRLGMQFKTADEAYTWYNNYARQVGFSVRINGQEKSKRDGEVISRVFVCSREGKRRDKDVNREKRSKGEQVNTRIGCQAYLMVKRRRGPTEDIWEVTRFHELHNHDLMSPTKAIFLRSHRRVKPTAENYIENLSGVRVHGDNTLPSPVEGTGGLGNVGVSPRNLYNHLSTKRREGLAKGDAKTVLDYCKEMQKNNPSFFYAMQIDEEDRLCNFFWADARSRMTYRYFGDVVCFDTMYKIDQYKIPLVPFTGVNHHKQPVLFGCALLCEDTEASFVWLFTAWLDAMHGRHPATFITDQDEAMAKAAARVFPRTNHRLSMWHIVKRAPDKLPQVYNAHKSFGDDFHACYRLSETIDQFEERWRQLIIDYNLGENAWLQSLYEIREKWVPAFTRNTFCAGMFTSQQNAGMNSFFDGYVGKKTTLQEFVKLYDKALDHRYNQECEADFQTLYTNPVLKIYLPMEPQSTDAYPRISNPVLKMQLPMEIQAAETYTRVVFKEFQEELVRSLSYTVEEVEGGWDLKTYRVRQYWHEIRPHTVTFNVSETRATCTCLMFESEGILCRHALKVFLTSGVLELPSYYILERWTRNARIRDVYDQQEVIMPADLKKSVTLRYNDLCRRAIKCAEDGATSVEVYDMAVSAIERCLKEITEAKKIEARNAQLSALLTGSIQEDHMEEASQVGHPSNQINLHDPPGMVTKIGPSNQMFDRQRKVIKTCSVCRGNDHDKRKCPHIEGHREYAAVLPSRHL
ncbi:protein FAR1-RELATED SEQUENCE 5-like [Magnolia sinica]|uniref:protein FAR1-RELATED SEQUENCE 5-like n=1 Tax=Magnolia sinica TaxID=86752 RepID=UPI002658F05D|nr:protein FAR1-RELATED SEQUENCE 5-like [Magnolia sinica]